jgi:2-C-methyl-D-erythritol 4-phosphate cytidylyltransferase/2-C-methyl-D-erythritol 2,4-cyclodiphosphate synthase
VRTAIGGPTRQQSVLAGLRALQGCDITHVLIHDAVRPFFDHDLLDRVAAALADGAPAVLPAIPVSDTLKRAGINGRVTETVPRAELYAAQTPQSFRFDAILAAHEKAALEGAGQFTDDAAIAEWAGMPVTLVAGTSDNVKLTTMSGFPLICCRTCARATATMYTNSNQATA